MVRCGLLRGRTPGRGFSGEPLGVVARAAGSGVSGRRCRAQCAVRGTVGAALHIRPGPARGRSAESCGNTSAFNAIEILLCAERPPLHMGARPLKIDILGRTAESCGKLSTGPQGAVLQCAIHPHGPGRRSCGARCASSSSNTAEPFSSGLRRCSGAGSAPRSATTATGPLLRRDVHLVLENDGWNCTFECEVHVSAPGGRPPRPPPGPRRPSQGPATAQVVQICCKGPDRAGAPKEKR